MKITQTRNPERTRARILDVAVNEFAAVGSFGARVERIAEIVGVNKRMIYHYFENKQGLYEAALACYLKLEFVGVDAQDTSEANIRSRQLVEMMATSSLSDSTWARLSTWEALDCTDKSVVSETERRADWQRLVAWVKKAQMDGELIQELEASTILILLVSVSLFGHVFPQYLRMILAQDEHFDSRRITAQLIDVLRPHSDGKIKPRLRQTATVHQSG